LGLITSLYSSQFAHLLHYFLKFIWSAIKWYLIFDLLTTLPMRSMNSYPCLQREPPYEENYNWSRNPIIFSHSIHIIHSFPQWQHSRSLGAISPRTSHTPECQEKALFLPSHVLLMFSNVYLLMFSAILAEHLLIKGGRECDNQKRSSVQWECAKEYLVFRRR
jgi:hypothetical protein